MNIELVHRGDNIVKKCQEYLKDEIEFKPSDKPKLRLCFIDSFGKSLLKKYNNIDITEVDNKLMTTFLRCGKLTPMIKIGSSMIINNHLYYVISFLVPEHRDTVDLVYHIKKCLLLSDLIIDCDYFLEF